MVPYVVQAAKAFLKILTLYGDGPLQSIVIESVYNEALLVTGYRDA